MQQLLQKIKVLWINNGGTLAMFGKSLDLAFSREISTKSHLGEVTLFRCLLNSFGTLSPHFPIEEYHGSSKQVCFDPLFEWDGRKRARCELADILIIWFSDKNEDEIRITFLQAKYERRAVNNPVKHSFAANMEQCDLLGNRPFIQGVGKFNPPDDLLQSAKMPSIGSFGFFYHVKKKVELLYVSADQLCYTPTTRRYHKVSVKTNLGRIRKHHSGLQERVYATNIESFGDALYDGIIGSPLAKKNQAWLYSVLHNLRQSTPDVALLEELLRRLGSENSGFLNSSVHPGVNNVLLLKKSTEFPD